MGYFLLFTAINAFIGMMLGAVFSYYFKDRYAEEVKLAAWVSACLCAVFLMLALLLENLREHFLVLTHLMTTVLLGSLFAMPRKKEASYVSQVETVTPSVEDRLKNLLDKNK